MFKNIGDSINNYKKLDIGQKVSIIVWLFLIFAVILPIISLILNMCLLANAVYLLKILEIIIILQFIYFIVMEQHIKDYKYFQKQFKNLEFYEEVTGLLLNDNSVNKIEDINNVFLKDFQIKYSTIVLFNGTEFVVECSNVEQKYYNELVNLKNDVLFKQSLTSNVIKYVETNINEYNILYPSAVDRNIKSAMMMPMYYSNAFMGFWLLEDDLINKFDNEKKQRITLMKSKLIILIETIKSSLIIEKANFTDKLTNLYNNIFLYTKFNSLVDNESNICIAMFQIVNIRSLNSQLGRNVVDSIIIKIVERLKLVIGNDCIFIRHAGNEFIILFHNENINHLKSMFNNIKGSMNDIPIKHNEDDVDVQLEYSITEYNKMLNLNFIITKLKDGIKKAILTKEIEIV